MTMALIHHIQVALEDSIPEFFLLEGMLLKLKFQNFGHLIQRADSLEKTLMLGQMKAGGEGDDTKTNSIRSSHTLQKQASC